MPVAALYRAWLVLKNEVPTMRTDWPVLQQADRVCQSHLHNSQDWDLLSQQAEKTDSLAITCYYGVRKRGEQVWYCVSRCSKRFI